MSHAIPWVRIYIFLDNIYLLKAYFKKNIVLIRFNKLFLFNKIIKKTMIINLYKKFKKVVT
jgi:hypothetical protein